MAYKLLQEAGKRWRRVNALHLFTLVHAGARFPNGKTRILPDTGPEWVDHVVLLI